MTSFMSEQDLQLLHGMNGLHNQLLEGLTDADLAFSLPGNPTLGEMFRENGEIEGLYTESFKTFKQEFVYGTSDPAVATSAAKLRAWFQQLDAEMDAALGALTDQDETRTLERTGFPLPPRRQLEIYYQAVLIFFGKLSI